MSDLIRRLRLNSQDNPALGDDKALYAEAATEIEHRTTELEQTRAELREAQRLIKNLAPTGKYEGVDIEGWYKRAQTAEQKNASLDSDLCKAYVQIDDLSKNLTQLRAAYAKAQDVLEAADAYDQHWTKQEENQGMTDLYLTQHSRTRDLRVAVREWRKK